MAHGSPPSASSGNDTSKCRTSSVIVFIDRERAVDPDLRREFGGTGRAGYEAGGVAALKDKRLVRPSHRRASPGEVAVLGALYGDGLAGWNVLRFYDEVYVAEQGGTRSYTWVKNRLQELGLVKKGCRKGPHRERRERKSAAGMLLHQDGSRHEWVPGRWWDLVVTMHDARSRVYSGFFVKEEGTWSSFRGIRETVEAQGLFDSLYTDRGTHYWHTPKAGGKVDKENPTRRSRWRRRSRRARSRSCCRG